MLGFVIANVKIFSMFVLRRSKMFTTSNKVHFRTLKIKLCSRFSTYREVASVGVATFGDTAPYFYLLNNFLQTMRRPVKNYQYNSKAISTGTSTYETGISFQSINIIRNELKAALDNPDIYPDYKQKVLRILRELRTIKNLQL